jgi:hypothetical protein
MVEEKISPLTIEPHPFRGVCGVCGKVTTVAGYYYPTKPRVCAQCCLALLSIHDTEDTDPLASHSWVIGTVNA